MALNKTGIFTLIGLVVFVAVCFFLKAFSTRRKDEENAAAAKRVSDNHRDVHDLPLRNPDGSLQPVEAGPEGVGRGEEGADNPTPYGEHGRDIVLTVPKPAYTEGRRETDLEMGLGGSAQSTADYVPPPAYSPPAYSPPP